jgi:hypothetical protein
MAQGIGQLVQATDYNAVQSDASLVFGIGSGTFGYGQNVLSSQIVATNGNYPVVSALQWNNLRSDILSCIQHQDGIDHSGDIPVANSTNYTLISNTIYTDCISLMSTAKSNALVTPPDPSNGVTGQATLANLVAVQIRTSAWNATISQTITVTWPSTDAARFFWNSGSDIRISSARGDNSDGTGAGAAGTKNYTWSQMLSGMGTIIFNYNTTRTTGTGTPASSYGWNNLPGTSTQIFLQTAPAGNYAPNDYYIYATKLSNSQLQIVIQWQDNDVGHVGTPGTIDENVTGYLYSYVQAHYATGANVSVPLPPASTSSIG